MVAAVVGAAALTVLGSLMSSMMQQEQARDAQRRAEREAERQRQDALAKEGRDRIANAETNQLATARSMTQGDQDAIGQLMSALSRTAR